MALQYRYKVKPSASVNSFKPKVLGEDLDKMNLRSAQIGALFDGSYHMVKDSPHAALLWEAAKVFSCSMYFCFYFLSPRSLIMTTVQTFLPVPGGPSGR